MVAVEDTAVVAKPFILDSDGGVDDAQALLVLIANGRTPDVITAVFGNVGLEAATANLLTVLAVAGKSVPVYKGCDRPLAQPIIDAKAVHGEDGLGGAPRPPHDLRPMPGHAVDVIRDRLRQAAADGETIDLVMIGPLTNLALALSYEPAIVKGIGTLTIMGGTVHGRGNTTPAAEFNIYADPEAASIVFSAAIDIVVVPWEACTAHRIEGAAIDALFARLPEAPATAFSKALVTHARAVTARSGRGDVLSFVDPLAAGVFLDPSIVRTSLRASIGVALAPGLTRGMTVIDPRRRLGTPVLTIVEEVDLDRMIAFYEASAAYDPTAAA